MKKNKITYAITVSTESFELDRLLKQLSTISDINDHQVLIQYDIDTVLESVMHVIYKYANTFKESKVIGCSLNKHFANFKNNLFDHSTGDWIFQIDADEYLEDDLLNKLSYFINESKLDDVDVILLPRINVVENITQQHIEHWRWRVYSLPEYIRRDSINNINIEHYRLLVLYNLIIYENNDMIEYYIPILNWYDHQWRLYRNTDHLRWINSVHEVLDGTTKIAAIEDVKWSLVHIKGIDKQVMQNNLYQSMQV